MKKIVTLLALCSLAVPAMAVVGSGNLKTYSTEKEYCAKTGGDVITLSATYPTAQGVQKGLSHEFCGYTRINGSSGYLLGLEELSQTPSLAGTYAKKLSMHDQALLPIIRGGLKNAVIPFPGLPNPSTALCHDLNGTQIAFAASGAVFADEHETPYDICVFGDGSMISAWSLLFLANGAATEIKDLIVAKPLEINLPVISKVESSN